MRLALDMLIAPYLNELSDSGRVNIFVYLASTMAPAWTPVLFQRWTIGFHHVSHGVDGVSRLY